jgi:ABC-2 type transport system ATP-binding protein
MAVMIKTVNLTEAVRHAGRAVEPEPRDPRGGLLRVHRPNGAGKSTTIKILPTLLQPTWGEARVCDFVVGYQSRQIRPLIGYVPDYFGAYEDMVVQEYLEFFAAAYNINGRRRTES